MGIYEIIGIGAVTGVAIGLGVGLVIAVVIIFTKD